MMGCMKCQKVSSILFLLLGIAFIMVDLGVWTFWDIKWWSALLIIMGIGGLAATTCKDCQAIITRK